MGVKVRQRNGAWWLFIDHHGQRKAKRVGVGPTGKKAADAAAVQIQAKLVGGDTSPLHPVAPASPVTFGEYAERWLTDTVTPHRKTRTEDYYRQVLTNHLKARFGAIALVDIKPPDVRAFVAEKLNGRPCAEHDRPVSECEKCVAPRARNTVKNIVATLRTILYQAQTDELIARNPAARFGKVMGARHDPREHVTVLDAESVGRVLAAAAKWYPDHEPLVTLLFQTGQREGEALGLHWEDFDWQRNIVDLRRTVGVRKGRLVVNTPKSGKLRTVDLPSGLSARLRELRSIREAQAAVEGARFSPWVFPALSDPDKPLNASWFWRHVWEPLLRQAEVRHIRVHDARHTYASLMLRRGVPPAYVSRQLGHSSIKVTVDLYGHFMPGADRHHVEALADTLEDARAQQSATLAQPALETPAR